MNKLILSAVLATLPLIAAPAFAADEINVSNGISAAGAPLAVHGSDPVALLSSGKSVEGTSEFSATFDGASYYFASAENQKTFEANPAQYVPQHGGFCSFGVSVGKKFDGDPDQFLVHEGKLFLFLNSGTREAFMKDVIGTAKTADTQWGQIKHTAVSDL